VDRVTTVARRLGALDWAQLEAAYNTLERDARNVIGATLPDNQAVDLERAADMRFVGQGFEVVTVLPAGPYEPEAEQPVRMAFEAAYRKVFGLVPPVGEVEIINIRVAAEAIAVSDALNVPAGNAAGVAKAKALRAAWSGSEAKFVDMPVFDRYALGVGAQVEGPAIVEEASSTLILPRGACATVDPSGSLLVDLH